MGLNDTLLETLDRTIEEDFGPAVVDARREIDPFSLNLVETSMGVVSSGFGRGWKKIQVFQQGLGGAARWRSVQGGAPLTTGDDTTFVVHGPATPQVFPGYGEMTAPAYVQANATLKEMAGNFCLPVDLGRWETIDHSIADVLEATIVGTARRVILREVLAFWADSTGAYASGTKSGTTTIKADGTIASSNGECDADDGLTRYMCRKFAQGEALDLFEADGSGNWTQLNASTQPVFVVTVDDLGVTMRLAALTGSDITWTTARAWELHPRQSSTASGSSSANTTSQPTSLAAFIKSSGTVYGIDTAIYPDISKSLVKALSGGETTLSETVLNRYVGGRLTGSQPYNRIDKLVTTPGVKSKYINNIDFIGRRDRAASPVSLNEGYGDKWNYQRDGYEMMIETSDYCNSGTLYGLRMRDGNFQKLTPPSPKGAGKDSHFGSYVDFYAKLTGPTIFTPTRSVTNNLGQFSDFVEAPFKRWVEYMPKSIPGLKLTNLDEDIASS